MNRLEIASLALIDHQPSAEARRNGMRAQKPLGRPLLQPSRGYCLVLCIVFLSGWSSPAHAATVGELISTGASLVSGNSRLVFSDFAASDEGDPLYFISELSVAATPEGFSLSGGYLGGHDGTGAVWALEFTVTAAPGYLIDASTIRFEGWRDSGFDRWNGTSLADQPLWVSSDSGHFVDAGAMPGDFPPQLFTETIDLVDVPTLRVAFRMLADNFNAGDCCPGTGVSGLQDLSNGYGTVPEPSTPMLILAAWTMLCVAAYQRSAGQGLLPGTDPSIPWKRRRTGRPGPGESQARILPGPRLSPRSRAFRSWRFTRPARAGLRSAG